MSVPIHAETTRSAEPALGEPHWLLPLYPTNQSSHHYIGRYRNTYNWSHKKRVGSECRKGGFELEGIHSCWRVLATGLGVEKHEVVHVIRKVPIVSLWPSFCIAVYDTK